MIEENRQPEEIPLISGMANTFNNCLEIAIKKNADYADKANPFKNFEASEFVGVSSDRAILVRIMDKISRISNLLSKEAEVTDESINDSINDAINYLAILKEVIKK